MRTLTDVFAPGTPTLPEGLRTLVVSPERELEPGMTVRATFTFRNQGGAPATGVRVRFNLPEGLVYLVGSGKLDEEPLDDEQGSSPLLARAGAQIGDVAPGEERRIDIAYSVAGAIENGSTVELQAAVAAFELAPVGSNVVRLVAHSRPALENAMTNVAIETRHGAAGGAAPGGEANITVKVHNAGESSAHDVVVVAPIPEHTSYVPNSARVNGREFERELLASFDRVHAPIVAASLPASATVTLQYRVRVDDPLADGTAIVARAQIASQETAAFAAEPASLTVRAQADFEDDRTSVTVEPEYDVTPGSHVTVRAVAFNAGTTTAENVSLTLELPDHVIPVRGSFRIDGQPLRERKKESLTFDLGAIGAREGVEFVAEGAVLSPIADGTALPIRAKLNWATGERSFECSAVVRSQPRFSARNNRIVRVGGSAVEPSDECEATIVLSNDGSAPATDARLHLMLDPALDEVRVFDKTVRLQMDRDEVDLGKIDPYTSRRLTVRARVRTPYANRSDIRLGGSMHAREAGEIVLGEANWRVESHPAFSAETSQLQLVQDDVFRPNQLVEVNVRLRNEGTDLANNVRLRLYVSPEARLESVEGATRERSALLFGEIRPGGTVEAKLGIRLLRSLAKAYPVTIESVLTADAMLPVQLTRLTIVTTAEPNFSVGTLHSEPADVADAGDEVEFVLHVRNGGDGPARRVKISVDALDQLIYVPNSTRVNELPVRDVGAQSPLTSEQGIMLSDVDPGVEAAIAWREVVHNGLASGETIVRTVRVAYDGDRVDEIAAPELKVRCSPAFANAIAGLPFGLDGMLGPAFAGGQRALPDVNDRFVQLPPAMPVARGETAATSVLSLGSSGNGRAADDFEPHLVETVAVFDRDRLERTLKFLSEARFGGLTSHIFALRAFFPDEAGAAAESALETVRDALRETLDRLFIKLRLPNYVIAPRDLENTGTRSGIIALLNALQPGQPALTDGALIMRGACDADELRALAARLEEAPLATALPWAALARLMPSESDGESNYRRMLVTSLDDLAGVDETAFIDALQRRPYPVLDAALNVVCAQLSTRV